MRISLACACFVLAATATVTVPAFTVPLLAQASSAGTQAGAPAVQSSVGTVKSIGSGTLSLSTDKGDTVTVNLPGNVRVLQLAPGSTDLKTAQPAAVGDIAEGDRVLVSGRAGDAGGVIALRVVLMKGTAIAQNNATRQQDWQRRGSGGMVDAVDPAAHTVTITSGTHKETVTTTSNTIFRRYAPGSVKFEDASLSKLDDIQPGDQVRVRGDKSSDNTSIAADEIVSGAFRNVAGLVTRVDPGANTVTVNDLSTKRPVTITIAADSDLRSLPPEMAARFVARSRGGAAGTGAAGTGTRAAGTRTPGQSAAQSTATPATAAAAPGARPGYAAAAGSTADAAAGERTPGSRPAGAGGARGGDLSQVISRLPKASLADLKPGEAVMVVASGANASGSGLTAVTLLSGVEPLLAASPGGGTNSFSISPWSLGGGGGAEAGEGGGPQ